MESYIRQSPMDEMDDKSLVQQCIKASGKVLPHEVDDKTLVHQYIDADGTVFEREEFVERFDDELRAIDSSYREDRKQGLKMKTSDLDDEKIEVEKLKSSIEGDVGRYFKIEIHDNTMDCWDRHQMKSEVKREDPDSEDLKNKPERTKTILTKENCRLCDISLSRNSMNSHMRRVHFKEKNHQCKICSYCAFEKRKLSFHINSKHVGNIKANKCRDCNFSTAYPSSLSKHVRNVHLKEKNHKCQFCSYTAFQSERLKYHLETKHNFPGTMKKYECEQCEYKTVKYSDLRRHVRRVHLKHKNHKCNFCNYSSFDMKGIKRHLEKKHNAPGTKSKKYNCEQCEYATIRPSDLKRHIKKVHLKEKKRD